MCNHPDIAPRRARRLSRRTMLAGLTAASMSGLIAAPGAVAGGRRGQKKPRKVTKPFRQFTPITIPSSGFAEPYPSVIKVSGFKSSARITDLNLTLHNVSHRYLDDLDILLQAPTGERCVIISDAGNTADLGITLTFDDAAAAVIGPNDEGVTGGTYRPANYEGTGDFGAPEPIELRRFNGLKPNGNWLLYVYDDLADGSGAINGGWSLRITVKQPR